jgi:hypothetical protein
MSSLTAEDVRSFLAIVAMIGGVIGCTKAAGAGWRWLKGHAKTKDGQADLLAFCVVLSFATFLIILFRG